MLAMTHIVMQYKAIIADVDGTLICPNAQSTTHASKKVIEAVMKVRKLGVVFTLASARSLDWVEGLIKSLKLSSPIILDNGARIYDCAKKKYIFESYLPPNKVKEVLKVFHKFNSTVYFVDDNNRFTYNPKEHLTFNKVVKIMILHVSPKKAQQIYQTAVKIYDIKVTKSISGENPTVESIHVTSKTSTKGKALQFIARYLNIELSEFIGIGDSYNDLEFIKLCGLKVAMSNATPDLKAIADYIAPSYKEDGVADVLERYILKNPKHEIRNPKQYQNSK